MEREPDRADRADHARQQRREHVDADSRHIDSGELVDEQAARDGALAHARAAREEVRRRGAALGGGV